MTRTRDRTWALTAWSAALVVALGCTWSAGIAAGTTAPVGTAGPAVPQGAPVAPDLPAVATDAGDAVIVSAADRTSPLAEADGNTPFAVTIPVGSTCPGDSANDDWRVHSFIVPDGTEIGTLKFSATRPRGENMYALYTIEGRPYAHALLAQNPSPGLPGQILDPPPFNFRQFTPDLLPLGRYTIGIACGYADSIERYWDVDIEVAEDTDVVPSERRWTAISADGVPTAGASGGDSAPVGLIVAVVAGAAVAVAAAVAWRVRARKHPLTPVKEYVS